MIPFVFLVIEDPQDGEFMETLYTSYNRLMYSEIKKILKNNWDAEDVQQMALIRLIGKIPLLRTFGRNQLVNYIITASRNTALNYIRDNKRVPELPFDENIDAVEDVRLSDDDNRLIMIETLEDVGEAWRALDPRSRQLLELKYILDESNEEIAREVDVSPNSVRMLLTRARNKLKAGVNRGDVE